jgi:hypothetical protein
VLGLRTVHKVAEDPTSTVEALAVQIPLAVLAPPASGDARDQYPVSFFYVPHRRSGLHDRPDSLVSEGTTLLDRGYVALEYVQVRPADRRGVDPDYGIFRLLDAGIRLRFPLLFARTVVDQRLHALSSPFAPMRAL